MTDDQKPAADTAKREKGQSTNEAGRSGYAGFLASDSSAPRGKSILSNPSCIAMKKIYNDGGSGIVDGSTPVDGAL